MEARKCKNCQKSFVITDVDFAFYEKMSVPVPAFCPPCRLQRKLCFRMERTLYFRTCDLSGKKMMSIIAPDSPYKAYQIDEWYSDKWNALDYGRDFNFNKPFFEQFSDLMKKVPLLGLNVVGVQNCEYVNQVGWSKDCYLIIEADYDEACMYSYRIFYSKTSVDCTEVFKCERCYECVDCENCFNVRFSQLSKQCADSAFLYDCRGCTDCFGCVGLRQKKYCLFNEQLSKEEYERRVKPFDFCDSSHVTAARNHFEQLKMTFPRKTYIGEMNENVQGNYIYESKDCTECFGMRGCRDCRYCNLARTARDCMDYFVWGSNAERIYESQGCGENIFNLRFCSDCWDGVHDLTYCFQCVLSTNNCFGCVGLKRQQYCILNKQYSKEAYEALVPKIIEHMKKDDSWGEFFPAAISPYSYNETTAQEYFPSTKEDVHSRGLKWRDNLPHTTGKETLGWEKIPTHSEKVPDSITGEILACTLTGRNYRITAQELKFYKEMKLPMPRLHPDERHLKRMLSRNPNQLWERKCMKCGVEIKTTYAPERPETVYCEKCYLAAVY